MNEQRLIDANAVLDYLENLEPKGGNAYYRDGCNDMLHSFFPKIIRDAPTIKSPVAQWTSVKDGFPMVEPKELSDHAIDNGIRFLVCYEGGYIDTCTFWARRNKFGDDGVTHWMPLPEPPTVTT